MNLSTEAISRASARRPWTVVAVWIVVFLAMGVSNGILLDDALTTEFSFIGNPESKRADLLLEERMRGGPRNANEVVVIQSANLTVDDPAFQQEVEKIYGEIVAFGPETIKSAANFYQTGAPTMVSDDRRTTIIPIVMAGKFDVATTNVKPVLELVREANGVGGFKVLMAGESSVAVESNEVIERDLAKGEGIAIPIAIIILILVFGAAVAALIPLILAIFAIVIALGLSALIGLVFDLSFFIVNMITMIGLAVGIDYALFVVSRYREERVNGLDKHEAIGKAGATASRAVFFSGITVVVALIGMLIIPTNIYASLATGAILVVLASVVGSVTLLPAILSLLGDKVNILRIPYFGRPVASDREHATESGFWHWITRVVMKQPAIFLIVTVVALLAASSQLIDMKTGFNGVETFPEGLQSREAFEILEKEFSFGLVSPTEIVVDGDVNSQSVKDAIQELTRVIAGDPGFLGTATFTANDAGDLGLISVPIAGNAAGDEAITSVERLRDTHIKNAFAGVPVEVLVTGATAFNMDFFAITDQYIPIVFTVVLGLSFIFLMVVFRSIVVPIKAIIMNLLSVGAAYGLIVLVFQKGFAIELFGFTQTPIIDDWIPLFLFSVLFGLSMDYHVFLLSRIRERYDQTRDNTEAVAYGLQSTARLITGAALIMVAVFAGFAAGDLVALQQTGFGLGVAVLLDATIIRSILVPASMRLLGNANWYLPSVLSWLPDLRVELPETEAAAAAAD